MRCSDQIDQLAAALAKAQGALDDAAKDATNPDFASRYADLASVRDAIRKPLSDNELAYVQLARSGKGYVEVETVLMHASGQLIADVLRMPAAQQTPQGFGSALTYCRRYALMAMIGVATSADDDDGRAASQGPVSAVAVQNSMKRCVEPAISKTAIEFARSIRACASLAEIKSLKSSEAFVVAWGAMHGVDRKHLTIAGEKRKAELLELNGAPHASPAPPLPEPVLQAETAAAPA